MKKKILSVISLLLAGATVLLTACQHGENEPINGSTGDGSIVDTTDSGSEDGSDGDEPDEFYFPEYEPDPAPTEKITVSPKRIASGKDSSFRIALDGEGKLWGWGANDYGQVGNGEQTTKSYDATVYTPQEAKTETRFVSVSAGYQHALGIDEEGNLWGWGRFDKPDVEDSVGVFVFTTPTQLMVGKKYVYAEAGSYCSFIIDTDGKLWAWGSNSSGKLGNGATSYVDIAVQIATDKRFSSVSSYANLTYAIDTDGKLWGWGASNRYGIGDGTTGIKLTPTAIMPERKFAQVSTSGLQTYAIDEDGKLWGWGSNSNGQLGDGTQEKQLTPVPIMEGKYFTYVEATPSETYAIDARGDLWVWGNKSNVLNIKYYPQKVEANVKFLQVSQGLALDENGEFWTWGNNSNGEVGDGITQNILSPMQVFEDKCFSKIVNALNNTYAIDTDGNLFMWGSKTKGAISAKDSLKQIMPGKKFKEIAVGGSNFAIDIEGRLWQFYNTLEQEAVQIMPDKKFIQVEAGSNFSFAIDAQRNLWAWGNSGSEGGCLGLGSNIHQQETPEMVKKGVKFVQVEVGYDFVAAIDTEGNFWGWGCNKIGQLGRENSGVYWEPMRFWKNETFSKLAFYKYSSSGIYIANYALNSAGKLYAWFSSLDSVPYTDLGLQLEDKTFIDVETGINHTLAIDSNGKLCVWGFNSHGQLGLGTKGGIVNILNYQVIMPEKQFRFISASMNTSFAIDTEGKLWTWGFNGYGELNGAVGQNFPKKLAL